MKENIVYVKKSPALPHLNVKVALKSETKSSGRVERIKGAAATR